MAKHPTIIDAENKIRKENDALAEYRVHKRALTNQLHRTKLKHVTPPIKKGGGWFSGPAKFYCPVHTDVELEISYIRSPRRYDWTYTKYWDSCGYLYYTMEAKGWE